MKIKNKEEWDKAVEINKSNYGKAVIVYAERWADLMEQRIAEGTALSECAEKTSREADTEGITGFMYGCAVVILSVVWECGEDLRRWSNLALQVGDEGERANADGGVLNPAILTIG